MTARADRFASITRRHSIVPIGSLVIVFDPRGRFDGVVIKVPNDTCCSSYDHDAGTYYVDDHAPAVKGAPQCGNCSRYGHNLDGCANRGVMWSDKQRRAKIQRQSRTSDLGWIRDRERALAPYREAERLGKIAARNAEIAKRWPNLKKIPARASP